MHDGHHAERNVDETIQGAHERAVPVAELAGRTSERRCRGREKPARERPREQKEGQVGAHCNSACGGRFVQRALRTHCDHRPASRWGGNTPCLTVAALQPPGHSVDLDRVAKTTSRSRPAPETALRHRRLKIS